MMTTKMMWIMRIMVKMLMTLSIVKVKVKSLAASIIPSQLCDWADVHLYFMALSQ